MPRINISPTAAAEIASLSYLIEPGTVLTRAEVVDRILHEWRQAKRAELAKRAKPP
jgi:hypothetical protein